MESNEEINSAPIVNRQAILSLVFGILTLITFCIGWLPVPFTGILCFPFSLLFGILALILGIISLIRLRKENETGHHYAWSGVVIGGFVFLCILCMLVVLISLLIYAPGTVPIPHFIDRYF